MRSQIFKNTKNAKKAPCQEKLDLNPLSPTNFTQKNDNILFVIKFRRNFEMPLSTFIKKMWIVGLVYPNIKMETTTQNLQLVFVNEFQNILPNSSL